MKKSSEIYKDCEYVLSRFPAIVTDYSNSRLNVLSYLKSRGYSRTTSHSLFKSSKYLAFLEWNLDLMYNNPNCPVNGEVSDLYTCVDYFLTYEIALEFGYPCVCRHSDLSFTKCKSVIDSYPEISSDLLIIALFAE